MDVINLFCWMALFSLVIHHSTKLTVIILIMKETSIAQWIFLIVKYFFVSFVSRFMLHVE